MGLKTVSSMYAGTVAAIPHNFDADARHRWIIN